ncbi:MAG: DUF1704 domain-containing protein [Candidatus Aminicenantes bacterium]|nr:DUF1704 domain-containing protein [Candidatus Aminicenantes bacterium]
MKKSPVTISPDFTKAVCDRLSKNYCVRRSLPSWGRLNVDRKLPFLCVYRRPREREDTGTEKLVQGEASYLMASGHRLAQKSLSSFLQSLVGELIKSFGAFLVIEVWSSIQKSENDTIENGPHRPIFHIYSNKDPKISTTVKVLEEELKKIRIGKMRAEVQIIQTRKTAPPGFPDFLSPQQKTHPGYAAIGLEVNPIYRDAETGQFFPLVLRRLQRQLSRAFKKTFYKFSRSRTTLHPAHFLSLGRRKMVKAVWAVDLQLSQVSDAFDFLLLVTPTDTDSAWGVFKKNGFESDPKFTYRYLPIDPAILKRQLYSIPLERIEEPVIAQLFREKQEELDRKIGMLNDRGSRRFLWGSLQLYGGNDKTTIDTARDMLHRLSPYSRDDSTKGYIDAESFARRAADEIAYYRAIYSDISAEIEVRGDIPGLMVSRGKLLIGKSIKVPVARVEALIQHEIGTHLLTYMNGKFQPFRQLYSGLAGYEELQEGLGVLGEYLAGGLTRPRIRMLAARVIATHCLIEGASFVETFRKLNQTFGFQQHSAFMVTMRVFRSGGLTKDAVYLKGFLALIQSLKRGEELEPLFVGKIGAAHIPIIRELQWRKVLHPPPLRPRYMADPKFQERLDTLRNSTSLSGMIKRRK